MEIFMKPLSLIVAMDRNRVIGKGDELPWYLPADMKHFKETTWGSTVIMGSKTWNSIPEKFRPLECRQNIILSRTEEPRTIKPYVQNEAGEITRAGACYKNSLDDALTLAYQINRPVYIIGGTSIYEQCMDRVTEMVITYIDAFYEGDVYFPEFDKTLWEVTKEFKGGRDNFLTFQWLKRKP